MRINELARKSVVFLGVLDSTGAFAPYGTGFIALWPERGHNFAYLVTAKHVVEDMVNAKRPIVARVNAVDGTARIGSIDNANWQTHQKEEKCDIALVNFAISPETFDIRYVHLLSGIVTEEYIVDNDVGCGDEVYMVGLLVNHFGQTKNVSIVRVGNISAMPDERVYLGEKLSYQQVYLIESRSIGGLSGSPVFLQTPPFRLIHGEVESMIGHSLEYILGVNIGLFQTKAHGDTLPTDTATKREHFLEVMSAGISVVVPIQRVVEIIRDSPLLQREREEGVRRLDSQTGFVRTSAESAPDVPPVPIKPSTEEASDWRDPAEAARRRDETLRRMLDTPPSPRKGGKPPAS